MVSSKEHCELIGTDLTHGHTLVGHHDRSFVAKLLHLRTLHNLFVHTSVCVYKYSKTRIAKMMSTYESFSSK